MRKGSLAPVPGAQIGCASAGIKDSGALDVAVFSFARPAPTAAVFTQNSFAAAPVAVARDNLARCGHRTRAWLVNSGNANCATGAAGRRVAVDSCSRLARHLDARPEQILPFSTGPIMKRLDGKLLDSGARTAAAALKPGNWGRAADAIMTTDLVAKGASRRVGGLTLTGIAKGSGMIHPGMATMLAFIATDARLPVAWMRRALQEATAGSFNEISVDGDTSTNDAVAFAATGASGAPAARLKSRLGDALAELCEELAEQIVGDGEGATRLAEVTVRNFRTAADCRQIADSISCSPLIKTMLYARDPNIGRLLMAIGKTAARFDPDKVVIRIGGRLAFSRGARAAGFGDKVAQREFNAKRVAIAIDGGFARSCRARRVFCDLSHGYVRINSELHT